MPRCPKCRRTFRTLEDEQSDHDCPYCGYDGGEDHRAVTFISHRCDAGTKCVREDRIITAGYDAKGRIVVLEPGITISVTDHGPTFRHTGCPDLALERFVAEQALNERMDELNRVGLRPEEVQ